MIKKSELKKISFIPGFLFLLELLFHVSYELYGEETGYKYFKNFSVIEYEHAPQNWGIAQAENGIIYVANHGGVLIYDGVSWRIMYNEIPNLTVRSLSIDESGTVYIGGKGEIGYLYVAENGSLKYKSLSNSIGDDYRNFSNVYRTHAVKDKIYFRTPKFIFCWDSKEMIVVGEKGSFKASFLCRDDLFVQKEGQGLMKLVNDSLSPVHGGEIFSETEDHRIFMIAPYDTEPDSRTLLIGTRNKGFFLYDGTKFEFFASDIDDYLKNSRPSHGIRLTSGDFALATLNGGLVIIDSGLHLKYIFNKASGLQDENVKYVYEDNLGNLWLALNDGITKFEYNSPFYYYDERTGLPGVAHSVARHYGDLFVGTAKGLFVLRSQSKTFSPASGIVLNCWSLLSIGTTILAATDSGVFEIDSKNNTKRLILKEQSYVLSPSAAYPGRAWCGTNKGLVFLARKNDRWEVEHRFKKINRIIRQIVEAQARYLWLVTDTEDVLKIDFETGITNPAIVQFDSSHGLLGEQVYVTGSADHVIFATTKGLFRFSEKEKCFNPDPMLGDQFTGGPQGKPVFRIIEDRNKNIWFNSGSRNFLAVRAPGGTVNISSKCFMRLPGMQTNAIYPGPGGQNVWFAGIYGLIRYDTTVKKNCRQSFRVLIRKVLVRDKLIYGGNRKVTAKEIKSAIPLIPFRDRNLRFHFAAPFFEAEAETLYRCKLDGYDKEWTTWSKETWKDYTNIDSGIKAFRVQAKNIYGISSSESAFRFRVKAPWYEKWWAFLLYIIGFFLLTFLLVKWRSNRLEHEKQKLEQIVKERTKEIEEKNEQLEKKTLQLEEQSEKLKELDKVKSRFFTNISHEFRTPLTLVMSPLEEMLSETREEKQKKRINLMLRSSQRLLGYINQLLDLSRFDSGEMKLKASRKDMVPFLKGIVSAFQVYVEKSKLKLTFHSQEDIVFLYFDSQKIEEVMNNLLVNAVKFTPGGGKITVSVYIDKRQPGGPQNRPKEKMSLPRQGFVNISVEDTGIGMPKKELDHIFDRFFQAKTHKDKDHKGTGIGLALTREIINLHHGKIDVHSQEGKGTEFVIHLPLGKEHLKEEEIVLSMEKEPELIKAKELEALWQELEEDTDMDVGKRDELAGTGKQGKDVILIVEDNRDMRKHIRSPLEPHYKVVESVNGKDGIEKAKEIIPDLIISDIMMPEADGYELCRELKNDIDTSHIPIILLTAKASEASTIQGLETGADDYITKPFNSKMLLARIKNLIALRRQIQLKIQRRKTLLPDKLNVSSMDLKFIDEFQDIIEKNLSDSEFNVDQLSKKLYMGRSTLFRKVQALTGETPNQFILSHRLERAAKLLKNNFGNVTEVALEVGFSNPPYFAKCFKEKFFQSPSSYLAAESQSRSGTPSSEKT